jgi:putative endonuclease
MSGLGSHRAGLAAEAAVADHYRRRGQPVAARRWRGGGGEIDLIARNGDEVVFVEVKHAATLEAAAWRITDRQMARVAASAEAFVAGEPRGALTPMRFDVALVDRLGRIEIREAAWTG